MLSTKYTLLFSAILATALAGETREGRQFLPADIKGQYDLFVKQGSCSKTVEFKSFIRLAEGAYSVPHTDITEDGTSCTGTGSFTVITKEAIVNSGNEFVLQTPPLANVVNTLDSQGATFMLGFERDARVCGSSGTSANAIVVFVEEEKKINIPGLITLFPGAKYMIVYEPSSPTPCTYFAKVPERTIGIPATPKATVTPEPSEEIAEEIVEETSEASATQEDKGIAVPGIVGSDIDEPEASEDGSDDEFGVGSGAPIGGFEEEVGESPEASSEEDDGSTCFPAEATVEIEGGLVKRMDELEIGDRVKVSTDAYSEVFMFTHKMSRVEYSFLELKTDSGASLSVTKGHYIYVNGRLAAAESVRVGDELEVSSGSCKVTSVSTVRGKGLYNPQTIEGTIMVNGVKASTYTTAIEKTLAHSLLTPLRSAFRAWGISIRVFEKGADRLAKLMPSGGLIA